jgi:hypothetical protein
MLSLDLNEQEAFFPDIESSILNLKELTPLSRLTLRLARKLGSNDYLFQNANNYTMRIGKK